MSAVKIEATERIDDVDPEAWNALAPGCVVASHGWLRLIEETSLPAPRPLYLLASSGEQLVGAAICQSAEAGPERRSIDNAIFGRLAKPAARLGISFLPAWLCGARSSLGVHLPIAPHLDADARTRVAHALLGALEDLADASERPVLFRNLMPDEGGLLRVLQKRRYRLMRSHPATYLDIPWRSFDGYLEHLRGQSRHMAHNVRKELRRGERAGIAVRRIEDPAVLRSELHRVATDHCQRLNARPLDWSHELFGQLRERLGPRGVVYAAFKGTTLVAYMLQLRSDRVAYNLLIGIDREVLQNEGTYFNIGYYAPIRDAIEDGIGRIYFGKALYETKRRRGARLQRVFLAYRPRSRLAGALAGPLFSLGSRWLEHKLPARVQLDDGLREDAP